VSTSRPKLASSFGHSRPVRKLLMRDVWRAVPRMGDCDPAMALAFGMVYAALNSSSDTTRPSIMSHSPALRPSKATCGVGIASFRLIELHSIRASRASWQTIALLKWCNRPAAGYSPMTAPGQTR
jgi:hypothetical protein